MTARSITAIPPDVVDENGAGKNSILNFKNGIITRGVLMDMARYKGVDWLEPGTADLSRRPGRLGEEGGREGRSPAM